MFRSLFEDSIPPSVKKYLGEPDYRVKNWMLLNSPLWLIGIVSVYFTLLLTLSRIMKQRKPFKLRKTLIVYNSFQVLYSLYICIEIFMSAYLAGYKLSCTNYDKRPTELNMRMATAFWAFYLSKVIDLCDTVFFVLRKKKSQLTFLHLYHHSTMIFNWYLGTLYLPGGQAFFSVLFNSFVHVIMYTYYLLSAMGPSMQKYLWWKKFLTQIQLIQFLAVMLHIIVGYRNQCKAPIWLSWFTISYLCTLVSLFGNFYYKSYKQRKVVFNGIGAESVLAGTKSSHKIDYKAGGDYKIKKIH